MANSFVANQAASIAGTGDFTFTVVDAGSYTLSCKTTIPCDPSGSSLKSDATDPAQSALQIVLKQNSTTLVTVGGTATNPTPRQGSMAASTTMLCSAGDVVHVVLSSANAIDAVANNVKSVINFYLGL